MAHPHHEHRQHKVERSRVAHITRGYASGGAVHSDAAEDAAMIKHMVKPSAMKVDGAAAKHRGDKRARGGRTKHKGATINILNAPGHGMGGAPPMPSPAMAAPMPPRPMPVPSPAPPMAAGPGPGAAPGMPPGMPIRHTGGRAYAKGGGVTSGPAWKGGLRSGTQVQHSDGKSDGKNIGRGKPVTYATGGAVEHPVHGGMGPKFDGGSGGGAARIEKEERAERRRHK